jgi:hypothetical protein
MRTGDQAGKKFEKWQQCRSDLDKKTRLVQQEMSDYLAGNGSVPSDLLAEVLDLQRKCLVLFEDVVKAMNKP